MLCVAGRTYFFVHNQQICGSNAITLYPAARDLDSVQTCYTITTCTGRQHGAATDAGIFITLRSTKSSGGDMRRESLSLSHSSSAVFRDTVQQEGAALPSSTGCIGLESPQSGVQPFQRGQTDVFKVKVCFGLTVTRQCLPE